MNHRTSSFLRDVYRIIFGLPRQRPFFYMINYGR